jgi:hypothetical protein
MSVQPRQIDAPLGQDHLLCAPCVCALSPQVSLTSSVLLKVLCRSNQRICLLSDPYAQCVASLWANNSARDALELPVMPAETTPLTPSVGASRSLDRGQVTRRPDRNYLQASLASLARKTRTRQA